MTEEAASEADSSEARKARLMRRALAGAFLCALVLLLLRALVFEALRVVGTSMDPTLREEDRVLVVKLPLDAKRGDLIVFKNPIEPAQNVIKRVVALEGDRVAIRGGRLYVNGLEIGEPYLKHPSDHDSTLDMPETVVRPGAIFVLGDNRIVSQDSRRPFGPIELRLIVGKAVLALWPVRLL